MQVRRYSNCRRPLPATPTEHLPPSSSSSRASRQKFTLPRDGRLAACLQQRPRPADITASCFIPLQRLRATTAPWAAHHPNLRSRCLMLWMEGGEGWSFCSPIRRPAEEPASGKCSRTKLLHINPQNHYSLQPLKH